MTATMLNNDTKPLRLREAEHRFGNFLQILGSYIHLELRKNRGDEARDVLTRLDELIEVLRDLHDDVSRTGTIDLAARLESLGKRLERLCGGRIRIVVAADEVDGLSERQVTAASMIALELVMNAMKHGFPGCRTGTIRVLFECVGPNRVILTVADDGIGACAEDMKSSEGDHHAHYGNGLIDGLAAALGGTIDRASQAGTGYVVSVSWPV